MKFNGIDSLKAMYNGAEVICKLNGVDIVTYVAPVVSHNFVFVVSSPNSYYKGTMYYWSQANAKTLTDNGVNVISTSSYLWSILKADGVTPLASTLYNIDPTLLDNSPKFSFGIKTAGTFVIHAKILDTDGTTVLVEASKTITSTRLT